MNVWECNSYMNLQLVFTWTITFSSSSEQNWIYVCYFLFRWPAVLCSSPASSDYFVLDHDGDPYSYHVEFLGTKHSIAWVHHEKITAYGNLGKQEALETCSQPISQVSMNRFRHKTKVRTYTPYQIKFQSTTPHRPLLNVAPFWKQYAFEFANW